MGNYSRDPVAALRETERKRYVGLHIEQGVPLLDRDLNLMHDLLAAAIRTALRDYVGDGTPTPGDDCFRVVPVGYAPYDEEERDVRRPRGGGGQVGADNDVEILHGAGRYLADGQVLLNDHRIRYSDQQGLPPLTTPAGQDRLDTVYLDVWTEEVGADEDAELRNDDDVGVQTAVRERRRWLVRVAEGADVPPPAEGHVHAVLALLQRRAGRAAIDDIAEVYDRRASGLNLSTVLGTMLTGFAPAFTAPGSQLRPGVGVAGTPITLAGRNLELAASVLLVPTGGGIGALTGVRPAERPGEVVAQIPVGAVGDCALEIGGRFGTVRTDDRLTVLRESVLPLPPGGADGSAVALNAGTQVVGTCTVAGRDTALRWERVAGTWQVGTLPELDTAAATGARATGVDDLGDVIGSSGGKAVAWLAGAGRPVVLTAGALTVQDAAAITPDGRFIAGHGALGMAQPRIAAVWRVEHGACTYAGTLPLGPSEPAHALSTVHAAATGLLAGSIGGMDGSSRAVVWELNADTWYEHEVFPDPATRPEHSVASAVNDAGMVAGTYQRDGETWLFLWDTRGRTLVTAEPGPAPCGLSDGNWVLANLPWPEAASGPPNWPLLWDRRWGRVLLVRPDDYAEVAGMNARGEAAGRRLTGMEALVWTAS